MNASVLYEELGGIWNLERLIELGLKKENVRLLQLSFHGQRMTGPEGNWWTRLVAGFGQR